MVKIWPNKITSSTSNLIDQNPNWPWRQTPLESTPQISASWDTDKFCLLKGEEILSLPLYAKIVLKLLLWFQTIFEAGIAHWIPTKNTLLVLMFHQLVSLSGVPGRQQVFARLINPGCMRPVVANIVQSDQPSTSNPPPSSE